MEDNNTVNQNQTAAVEESQSQQQPNISVKSNGQTMTATVEDTNVPIDVDTDEVATEDNPATDETTPNADDVQTSITKQQEVEKGVAEELKAKGIDFNALAKEFDENGELSQQSLQALEKAGYPKAVVDAYIAGLEATVNKFVSTVKSFAGGDKGYEELARYLQTQPKEVIDGFNAAIESGNLNQIKLTINGIKANMRANYGTSNPTIMSGQQGATLTTGYTSQEEMIKDMSDPRYQKDAKFTREVMRKVKYATIF